MFSSVALVALLGLVVLAYLWWERADRKKEHVVAEVAQDIAAMGDVVATSLSPKVDPELCIGSGACVAACPENIVIGLLQGRAQLVNPLGCIGHGACAKACPVDAIELVYGTKTRGVELPLVDENFQTNQPGVYIAGELGGMGLIRNAAIQGRQAAEHILAGSADSPPRRAPHPCDGYDAIIVGAGPAGIGATLRLMEAGVRVLLLDREGFGGTILHYPRAKLVMTGDIDFSLYGRIASQRMTKEQLVAVWEDIARKTAPPLVTGELVVGLSADGEGQWRVHSETASREPQVRRAANVVLALGGRGSPRKLGVPGEELPKVAYRLLEPEPFAGQHVLVVGGGNSAVESALGLMDSGLCASVAISYRRAHFARCRAENRARIDQAIGDGSIAAYMETNVTNIAHDRVTLADASGRTQQVANHAVIVQVGGTPPAQLLRSLGIELVTKYGER